MKSHSQSNRSNSIKGNVNGHSRSNVRHNHNNSGNSHLANQNSTHDSVAQSDDKLIYLVTKSLGKRCIVTVSSGARYEGLLTNADLLSNQTQNPTSLSVALESPRNVSKPLLNEKSNIDDERELPDKLIIPANDLIDVEVFRVDIKPESQRQSDTLHSKNSHGHGAAPPSVPKDSKFKTDSDISGSSEIKERELQKWEPDSDAPALTLEDNDNLEAWDQFKVNEEKFGVESTYDEHLYTTKINKDAPDYEEKLRKAEQIAREIENQATSDVHILEERGLLVDDSGFDEEDKYSGVDRRGDELMAALKSSKKSGEDDGNAGKSQGKYVPPRQRASHYHNDPAIVSSSATSLSKKHDSLQNNSEASAKGQGSSKNSAFSEKPDSIPPKPQVSGQHTESFRLNAQSEINALREFSANFKIPHKIPTDLLPILTKDKIKQDEILKKQQEQKQRKKDNAAAKNGQSASISNNSSSESIHHQNQTQKRRTDSKPSFKLNPKAAAFTPSHKNSQISSGIAKNNFSKSPNTSSPRVHNNQRPYTSGSGSTLSSGTSKRHHQISAVDFFGGPEKVPTRENKEKKIDNFKFAFDLFVTKKKSENDKGIIFDKTFHTPPTWDHTIDEPYERLFKPPSMVKTPTPVISPAMGVSFMPSPLMGAPSTIQGAYPGIPGTPTGKFPMSPHHQQHAAAFAAQLQQQQFHAAMMYQQQQFGAVPPGQPPVPFYAQGAEPPFIPPGFAPPPGAFMGAGSPVSGNVVMGGIPYGNMMSPDNFNHQGGNRRYNNHHHHHHHHHHNHQNSGNKRSSNAGSTKDA